MVYLPNNIPLQLKLKVKRRSYVTKAVKKSLIDTVLAQANPRDQLLIKCMYILGLRVSELVKLKFADFRVLDAQGKEIELRIIGKGDKERFVMVSPKLYQQLLAQQTGEYVFPNRRGGHLTRQAVNKRLELIAQQLELDDIKINPHAFRHSHATDSIANGCDLSLLQQTLGHSNITTTQLYLSRRQGQSTLKIAKLNLIPFIKW